MPESRKQAGVQSRQQIEARERSMKEIAEAYRSASEGHQWQPKGLTPQQKRALNELEEAVSELQGWRGIEPEDEEERHHQQIDQDIYEEAITRAVHGHLPCRSRTRDVHDSR